MYQKTLMIMIKSRHDFLIIGIYIEKYYIRRLTFNR
jgi:hypothetical protein